MIYIDPATSVVQKYQTAIRESEESERYYRGLCENLDSNVQKQWEEEMANAQALRTSKISAMDIFNPALENGMGCRSPTLLTHGSLQLHPAQRNNFN
jgi:hypothetical protein